MSAGSLTRRIADLEEALEGPDRELVTANSASSVRSNSGSGLATLPYLTIDDIIQLKAAGFTELEEIEERILEVPDSAWEHVVHLVEADVIQLDRADLAKAKEEAQRKAQEKREAESDRCWALTQSGDRCKNNAREGSNYCSSHKGYQPSEEELEARRNGEF